MASCMPSFGGSHKLVVRTCVLQKLEEVDSLLEVESCLEVGVLVEDGRRAGAVLLPLVAPETGAVAAGAS